MKAIKTLAFVIAVMTVVAQLYVPTSMAKRYADILNTGESYRFKVVPRDPADPFKGRYVRLTFPIDTGKIRDLNSKPDLIRMLKRNDTAYAILEKATDNSAKIVDLQKSAPANGDYVKIKMSYHSQNNYRIKLPFNRYYAEENKAPKIEALIWQDRQNEREFYADVRVKDGYGVIEELYVEGVPILDYLKQTQ